MTAPPVADARDEGGALGWWHALGRGQRAAFAVVALLVGVNVAAAALGGIVGRSPGGPVSSSFSTGAGGLRGWSELLDRRGHPVERSRRALAGQGLDPRETVVLADPVNLSGADLRAVRDFVRAGGRLVLAGPATTDVLQALTGDGVAAEPEAGDTVRWLEVPEVRNSASIVGGDSAWSTRTSLLPVAGDDTGAPTVLVGNLGRGRIVAVADAAVFQNGNLDRADNAAFALSVVGSRSRPVLFAESVHGSTATGLAAVPIDWKWSAAGLTIALILGMWSAGARFGSPEPDRRRLRPPRLDHVAAIAADLDRIVQSDADVVQPLVDTTRAALAARLGVTADASPAVLYASAEAVGLDLDEVAALTHPVTDPEHALQVGAIAAARQRAYHGITATATVPTDPASGGTSS